MNPFAEIDITPLYSRDGMQSAGKSVRIMDDESSSGWTEIGVVSPNYLLIHNSRLKEVVDGIAHRSNLGHWDQRKLFFDGKRFVYALSCENLIAEIHPGDLIRFGLIGYNSYDGSRAVSVGAYAEHLVCSNGMTSELYFARFTFRHHLGNINWDEQTEGAFRTLIQGSHAKLTRFAGLLRTMRQHSLSVPDLKTLRAEHLKELSPSIWGRVLDRYLLHEQHHAFGLLDACTYVFWHSEKQTITDYRNNSYATDALVRFASTW